MGAFASLLPGLRELRAPLAAGYIWLLDLWLIFGNQIPEQSEATGLIRRVYELEGVFSELGMGVAISFVAYLIGSLSEWGTSSFIRGFFASEISISFRRGQSAKAALMDDAPTTYGEYDRYRAEGEFRGAVVPPLFLLIMIVAVQVDWRWGLAEALVVLLGIQGFTLLRQSSVILGRYADAKVDELREEEERLRARARGEPN